MPALFLPLSAITAKDNWKMLSMLLNSVNCKEVVWRETRDVRKCNRDGEVIGENKTKFKATETR